MRCELASQRLLEIFDERFPFVAFFLQCPCNVLVGLRFEIAKRQILQFPLELPHAQAVRERCVDFLCFGRERAFLGCACALCEAHFQQLLGDANQHEPRIGHDGKQHLAKRLGLLHGERFARLPVRGQ